jgi:multiple sugar transport system ATP-binding protein
MRTEISRIQQRLGTTTIYVTHDQTEALTLGDRIAVMRSGVLQQVGPPGELYNRPTNLFVAGFIGSPSMNFLPGALDGDTIHLPIGDIRLPDEIRRRVAAGAGERRRQLIAGLRPEHFEDASLVQNTSRGLKFKAKIDVLAYFEVASERVSARELEELAQDAGAADLPRTSEGAQMVARLAASSQAKQGQEAELWFDSNQIQLFDPESGRSLLAGERERETEAERQAHAPASA